MNGDDIMHDDSMCVHGVSAGGVQVSKLIKCVAGWREGSYLHSIEILKTSEAKGASMCMKV